jgi:hypothetical protein
MWATNYSQINSKNGKNENIDDLKNLSVYRNKKDNKNFN